MSALRHHPWLCQYALCALRSDSTASKPDVPPGKPLTEAPEAPAIGAEVTAPPSPSAAEVELRRLGREVVGAAAEDASEVAAAAEETEAEAAMEGTTADERSDISMKAEGNDK